MRIFCVIMNAIFEFICSRRGKYVSEGDMFIFMLDYAI